MNDSSNNNFFNSENNTNNNSIPGQLPNNIGNTMGQFPYQTQNNMSNMMSQAPGQIPNNIVNSINQVPGQAQNGIPSQSQTNIPNMASTISGQIPNNIVNSINQVPGQAQNGIPSQSQTNIPNMASTVSGQIPNNIVNSINQIPGQAQNGIPGMANEIPPQTPTNIPPIMNPIYEQNHYQIDDNEELKRAFIGENYDKITTSPFNAAGFFWSSLYLFYRKMFLFGFLLFLINLFVLNIINNFYVTGIFNVFIGLSVNKIYLFYVDKRISKIKKANPQKTEIELEEICAKKGGTSIGEAILGFIMELIISIIVLIAMVIMGVATIFSNFFSDLNNNKTVTYEGVIIYDTSVDIIDEFTISVPGIFLDKSDSYQYYYEYSTNQNTFNKCRFSLGLPKGYKSADNLIHQMVDYNTDNNPSSVEKEVINNIDWYWYSMESSFGKTYYYGTTKNDKVYLLKYDVDKNAPSNCESYRQEILNTINRK